MGRTRKQSAETTLAQPNHTRDAPNPDIKIPKQLKQPKEKDEDLKTQKTQGTTQGENPYPETQKRPQTNQGEEPIKPENCRARRRRESQLSTVGPLESSTMRWIPRENALATWNCRYQEPRTAPVEVA